MELKASSTSIQLVEGGLLLDDGTLASSVVTAPEEPLASPTFNTDAYVNVVSILEQLCFAKAECDRVIDSNKLRKQAEKNKQVPEPFASPPNCSKAMPPDWATVQTHKMLCVRSWHPRFGWGPFNVQAAFRMWKSHSGSQPVPSVQDLRAYGYCFKFFEPCFEHAMERERLLVILRQPDTALAQYLVQHHGFWQQDGNVNRIDEIQEHFEGMTHDEFRRQVQPAALLEQLTRDRAVHTSPEQSKERFPCLKLVDPCLHQRGDLKVELITTPDALVEAARLLKNCGANYLQKAAEGKCFLLVLKRAGKLIAMAEWDPSQGHFVQVMESCNKRIRRKWKEMATQMFDEGVQQLPKRFVITFGESALMHHVYLSHPACEALGQMTKLNVGDREASLSLDSIFHLTESDPGSLPPGLTELICLFDMMRRYPQTAFKTAEALADVAIANQDMEFANQLCNIGSSYGLLLRACEMACPLEMISALIERGARMHEKDAEGCTPLHLAAERGHDAIAELLIACGANVKAYARGRGAFPLHLAAENGHVEVAEVLIGARANLKALAPEGRHPLHVAAMNDQVEVMRVLIKAGAEVDARDAEGCTPLHLAAETGHDTIAELLIAFGANVKAYARGRGAFPLHLAAENGHAGVAEVLIGAKANLKALAPEGRHPLHVAAMNDQVEVMRVLIKAGAEVDAQDAKGCTPFDLAALNHNIEAAQLLTPHGIGMN